MRAVCLGIDRTRRIRVPAALACGALMAVCILLTSCSSSPSPVAAPGARGDFQRGREAYEKGRHPRAIELLEDFERRHPGSQYVDDALHYLGKAHQARGEHILARQAFLALLDAFPQSTYSEDAWFELAHSWYLSMRSPPLDSEPAEEAIRTLRSYLRRFPEGSHRREAEEAIDDALRTLAVKDYLNGRTYFRLGRPGAARRYFQKSLDRWREAPTTAQAWDSVGRTYEKEKRWEEAREAYADLLAHLGDDPGRFKDGKAIQRRARRKLESLPR